MKNIKQSVVITFLSFIFVFYSFIPQVLATAAFKENLQITAEKTGHVETGEDGLDSNVVYEMIGIVIKAALSLIGIFFIVLIIYAGYTWMLSRGDEAEAKKAKDTISRAVIGLFIVLSAYAITEFIGRSV